MGLLEMNLNKSFKQERGLTTSMKNILYLGKAMPRPYSEFMTDMLSHGKEA